MKAICRIATQSQIRMSHFLERKKTAEKNGCLEEVP